jgi:hypothetical protein
MPLEPCADVFITIFLAAATFGGRSGQRWEYSHTEIAGETSLNPALRRRVTT